MPLFFVLSRIGEKKIGWSLAGPSELISSLPGDIEIILPLADGNVNEVPKGVKFLTPNPGPVSDPLDIERESFELIEELVSIYGFSGVEKEVVKRVVHASGDPMVAGVVTFSSSAVEAGIKALKCGAPVITDCSMVKSGLNMRTLKKLGSSVLCALELPGVCEAAEKAGRTRSYTAFKLLRDRVGDSIVVIGNAPTALLSLLELIEEGIKPSLVIGMPVGFIQAGEAKRRLKKSGVPYITVEGSRGGSPMAAAALNALSHLAASMEDGR